MCTRSTILAALGVSALLIGCGHSTVTGTPDPVADLARGYDSGVRSDLERVRAATDRYHDLAVAQAAGYPSTMPPCLADTAQGGMGHHFVDRKLSDDTLDLEHPEILLYAHQPDGTMKLTAVEYIVPYRVHPPTAAPPRIFGRDLNRHDELKIWGLHVWAWEKNPSGLFAEWNPVIKC